MLSDLSASSKQAINNKLHSSPEYAALTGHTVEALKRYLFDRVPPGYVLRCLLEGEDAVRAVLNFGEDTAILRALCMFIHWEVPSNLHGSKAKVAAWLAGAPTYPDFQSVDHDAVVS